jgi:hypothetical protein
MLMSAQRSTSRQLLLILHADLALVVVKFDIAVSAERAFLDKFSLFSHDILDSDAFVGEYLSSTVSTSPLLRAYVCTKPTFM